MFETTFYAILSFGTFPALWLLAWWLDAWEMEAKSGQLGSRAVRSASDPSHSRVA
jgi:hypothetical protein